jgi:hypothetical protein
MIACTALAGCGGGGGSTPLPDAPIVAIDAAVDAMPQPVTLTITQNGKPVIGVRTYFLHPDSSVVAMVDTDAMGKASQLMPLGGSVTALDPFAVAAPPGERRAIVVGNNELRTFAGVKPGDQLQLTRNDPPPDVTIALQAPTSTDANSYDVFTTCGNGSISPGGGSGGSGSSDPGGLLTLTGCNGTADLVVVARDVGEGTITRGVLYKANVALTETVTLIDPYVAPTDRSFTYVNPPSRTTSLRRYLVTGRGKLRMFDGPVADSVTVAEPTIAGASSIVDSVFIAPGSEHHVVDWGPVAAAYTLDPTGLLLPSFGDAPSWDQATNQVTWTEAASAAAPVMTTTVIAIFRGREERSWRWLISAPYSPGKLALPKLPTDVADWNPTDGDGIGIEGVTSAKVPGGYDAVRAFALNFELIDDASALVAGATGRAVVVTTLSQIARDRRARLRRR